MSLYFLVGALLLSILQVTGALTGPPGHRRAAHRRLARAAREAAANAFVMGFVRRDFGAAGLTTGPLSTQLLVALVTITLFVPCIASVMILLKERGWPFTAAVWFGSVGLAFFVGGVVAKLADVL